MGPLPGTFDVGRASTTEWSMTPPDANHGHPVQNGVTPKLKNKLLHRKTNSLSKLAINTNTENLVDTDLPDLITNGSKGGTHIPGTAVVPPGAHCIVQAAVSGFVPVRLALDEPQDMAYVVDVLWSDGRTHMVKRTFSDFYNFHFHLLDEWGTTEGREGPLRLTFYLPERQTGESETSIELAECRELQLNKYVQELIKLPQQISASPTVLTFFESRGTDPKPYRETVSPSQTEVADQYVLCWI